MDSGILVASTRYDVIMTDVSPYVCLKQIPQPRVNSQVNYGLWAITMYQRRFVLGKKCTNAVSDADDGGGHPRMGAVVGTGNLGTFLLILL